jgi:hypothetical protein
MEHPSSKAAVIWICQKWEYKEWYNDTSSSFAPWLLQQFKLVMGGKQCEKWEYKK